MPRKVWLAVASAVATGVCLLGPAAATGAAEGERTPQPTRVESLAEALREQGFGVSEGEPVRQPFLSVDGATLEVGGGFLTAAETVQVFVYADAETAARDVARIEPDASIPGYMISWVGTPHYFRDAELVVLYVGERDDLVEALQRLLGDPFAVGTPHPAGPSAPPSVSSEGGGSDPIASAVSLVSAAPNATAVAPPTVSSALLGGESAVTVTSPFPTVGATQELAEGLGRRAVYRLGYEAVPVDAPPAGALHRMRLHREVPADATTRVLEILVDRLPAGGYELVLSGAALDGDGALSYNDDLPRLQALLDELLLRSDAQTTDIFSLGLDFAVYQLSYVQSDRAMALLKALGYQTIEYSWTPGETDFEGIFDPIGGLISYDRIRLPLVVKVLDAGGQALEEFWDSGFGGGTESRAMDLVTSGEPQQRLMIVYEPGDMDPVEDLLNLLRDRVDVPARQVVIEAQVIEIDTSKLTQLGLSASGSIGTQGALNLNPLDGPSTLLFDEGGVPANDFRVTLSALLETGDAEILSNPSVLVLDGRQARIEIGQLIPVATSEATGVGFSTSVNNQRVGILLNLRPRISDDGDEITMQVETDVSALIEQITQRDANGNILFTAPQVDERRVESFVRVANDTPFIIGGLISSELVTRVRGVPVLSNIPLIGLLFRRTETERVKNEVIVVLTPHVVPAGEKNFRYAIPKGAEIFDSFGHTLFRNAYRIRDDDAYFDLDELKASEEYQGLRRRVQAYARNHPTARNVPEIASLLDGHIPGEAVLVRRMIWEIIRQTDYGRHVDVDRIIYFEENPDAGDGSGFELRFLREALDRRSREQNALALTFDGSAHNSLERPLAERNARASYEALRTQDFNQRLQDGNRGVEDSDGDWTILLSDVYQGTRAPIDTLRDVFVMDRVLALNATLEPNLDSFRSGRQIIFPAEESLRDRYHAIDRRIARYFYEVTHYYAAFQAEYRRQRAVIEAVLRGEMQ